MPQNHPWDPQFGNVEQERARVDGLTDAQLLEEHMAMFGAFLDAQAKVSDAASETRRHAWGHEIKRTRKRGRAMGVAIESGDMDDRFRELETWGRDDRPWDPRWRNAPQERQNAERWNRLTLINEHMDAYQALTNALGKQKTIEQKEPYRTWAKDIDRMRTRGGAMRDAIETGNMDDRFREKDAWDQDPANARDD